MVAGLMFVDGDAPLSPVHTNKILRPTRLFSSTISSLKNDFKLYTNSLSTTSSVKRMPEGVAVDNRQSSCGDSVQLSEINKNTSLESESVSVNSTVDIIDPAIKGRGQVKNNVNEEVAVGATAAASAGERMVNHLPVSGDRGQSHFIKSVSYSRCVQLEDGSKAGAQINCKFTKNHKSVEKEQWPLFVRSDLSNSSQVRLKEHLHGSSVAKGTANKHIKRQQCRQSDHSARQLSADGMFSCDSKQQSLHNGSKMEAAYSGDKIAHTTHCTGTTRPNEHLDRNNEKKLEGLYRPIATAVEKSLFAYNGASGDANDARLFRTGHETEATRWTSVLAHAYSGGNISFPAGSSDFCAVGDGSDETAAVRCNLQENRLSLDLSLLAVHGGDQNRVETKFDARCSRLGAVALTSTDCRKNTEVTDTEPLTKEAHVGDISDRNNPLSQAGANASRSPSEQVEDIGHDRLDLVESSIEGQVVNKDNTNVQLVERKSRSGAYVNEQMSLQETRVFVNLKKQSGVNQWTGKKKKKKTKARNGDLPVDEFPIDQHKGNDEQGRKKASVDACSETRDKRKEGNEMYSKPVGGNASAGSSFSKPEHSGAIDWIHRKQNFGGRPCNGKPVLLTRGRDQLGKQVSCAKDSRQRNAGVNTGMSNENWDLELIDCDQYQCVVQNSDGVWGQGKLQNVSTAFHIDVTDPSVVEENWDMELIDCGEHKRLEQICDADMPDDKALDTVVGSTTILCTTNRSQRTCVEIVPAASVQNGFSNDLLVTLPCNELDAETSSAQYLPPTPVRDEHSSMSELVVDEELIELNALNQISAGSVTNSSTSVHRPALYDVKNSDENTAFNSFRSDFKPRDVNIPILPPLPPIPPPTIADMPCVLSSNTPTTSHVQTVVENSSSAWSINASSRMQSNTRAGLSSTVSSVELFSIENGLLHDSPNSNVECNNNKPSSTTSNTNSRSTGQTPYLQKLNVADSDDRTSSARTRTSHSGKGSVQSNASGCLSSEEVAQNSASVNGRTRRLQHFDPRGVMPSAGPKKRLSFTIFNRHQLIAKSPLDEDDLELKRKNPLSQKKNSPSVVAAPESWDGVVEADSESCCEEAGVSNKNESTDWFSPSQMQYNRAESELTAWKAAVPAAKPRNSEWTPVAEAEPALQKKSQKRFSMPAKLENWDEDTSAKKAEMADWKSSFKNRYSLVQTPFIDSHCHLDFIYKRTGFAGTFSRFKAVHSETFPPSFAGCIAVFCNPNTWIYEPEECLFRQVLKDDAVWGAVGCHPKHATAWNDDVERKLRAMLKHEKIRALGEIGLDYSGSFYQHHQVQKKVLQCQVKIAVEYGLPLVIHSRNSEKDMIDELTKCVPSNQKIHRHCFTGDWAEAEIWLRKFPNSYLGVTPLVTNRTAAVRDMVTKIPMEKLLLETDSPYFLPKQFKNPTNELLTAGSHPGMAITVAETVAELRNMKIEDVLRICYQNTKQMYGLDP